MSIIRLMYHTQEFREPYINEAILCVRNDSWLGTGYYFWADETDAIYWGQTAKRRTGRYSVYSADVICDDVLDTVFNEDHYIFWLKQIEKAVLSLSKKSQRKLTTEDINAYFLQKGGWGSKVTGIMFQDIPINQTISMVMGFYFKKRIQLAVFDKEIITNFAHHFDGEC